MTFGTGLFGAGTFGEPAGVPPNVMRIGNLTIPDCTILIDMPRDTVTARRNVYTVLEPTVDPRAGLPDMYFDNAATPLDGAVLEGDTYIVDVTCDTVDISWRRGGSPGGHYDAGTATLVLHNPDGRYTPDYSRTQDGQGIRSGSQLQVTLNSQRVFTGRITAVTEDYVPGETSQVVCSATDPWNDLNIDLPELASPVGANEQVVTRLNRILTRANWPPERNGLPPAGSPAYPTDYTSPELQSTTLAGNLMTELKHAADHPLIYYRLAAMYLDASGVVRLARFNKEGFAHDAPTWTDDVADYFGVVHFEDCPRAEQSGGEQHIYWQTAPIEASMNLDRVTNDVTIACKGGTAQRAENLDSIARYGRKTWQRLDYDYVITTGVGYIARHFVAEHGSPFLELTDLEIDIEVNSQPPLPAWAWLYEWFWLFECWRHLTVKHTIPDPDGGTRDVVGYGRVVNLSYSLNRARGTITLTVDYDPAVYGDIT